MIWPFRRYDLLVLVVCTANVCRSPAAEALLKKHLARDPAGKRVRVWSAGTAVGAPGRRPDPRVVEVGASLGANLRGIRAKAIDIKDLQAADVVWVMEAEHHRAIEEAFAEFSDKVSLFDSANQNIEDPYYGSKAQVREVIEVIDRIAADRAGQILNDLH
ncbi:MAG: low molecular weight protein-tyrosine-phosphatase [Congregibacter sp.]